jgi:truncated hemoglobin YjbI
MTGQDLYERLGGVNAIAMVVDRFSDEIVKNPKLNVNPRLKEWNASDQLPRLKFMRTLWICEAAGGPFQYTGKDMHEAHKDLHIAPEEFDEVGAEIARALDHFGVPEVEKQELLAAIVRPSMSTGRARECGAGRWLRQEGRGGQSLAAGPLAPPSARPRSEPRRRNPAGGVAPT